MDSLTSLASTGIAGIALGLMILLWNVIKQQQETNNRYIDTLKEIAKTVEGFKVLLEERLPRK